MKPLLTALILTCLVSTSLTAAPPEPSPERISGQLGLSYQKVGNGFVIRKIDREGGFVTGGLFEKETVTLDVNGAPVRLWLPFVQLLEPWDVILEIGGTPVDRGDDLDTMILQARNNGKGTFKVLDHRTLKVFTFGY